MALRWAQAGWTIVGVDVDALALTATQRAVQALGVPLHPFVVDLAQAEQRRALMRQLALLPPIDVLINNAGISAVGRFGRLALAPQQAVLDINLTAPLTLTAQLLGERRLAADAALVFISSLSHFTGYPGASAYAATKSGLAAFARSVAVAAPALHVLTVYPGPTRTDHARRYSPDNRREHRRMPPDDLAAAIFRAVQRRQRILIPGWNNRLAAVFGMLLPRLSERLMARLMLRDTPS